MNESVAISGPRRAGTPDAHAVARGPVEPQHEEDPDREPDEAAQLTERARRRRRHGRDVAAAGSGQGAPVVDDPLRLVDRRDERDRLRDAADEQRRAQPAGEAALADDVRRRAARGRRAAHVAGPLRAVPPPHRREPPRVAVPGRGRRPRGGVRGRAGTGADGGVAERQPAVRAATGGGRRGRRRHRVAVAPPTGRGSRAPTTHRRSTARRRCPTGRDTNPRSRTPSVTPDSLSSRAMLAQIRRRPGPGPRHPSGGAR